tara:strand:- start:9202 stop:9915 length:714 start_codon:yes stop_codon:yes gene_type:complete
MTFTYEGNMTSRQEAKLAKDLQDKGLTLYARFCNIIEYGFQEVIDERTVWEIRETDPNGDTLMSCKWRSDAEKAYNAFKHLVDIDLVTVETTTTSKEWVSPQGQWIQCSEELLDKLDGEKDIHMGNILYHMENDEDNHITMRPSLLLDSYGEHILTFDITWKPKKIQRKDAIESAMVDTVFNDMVALKNIVEGRLKLKKYGIDVSNPEVDCNFKAHTLNESKCAPDIIQNIKDGKKG